MSMRICPAYIPDLHGQYVLSAGIYEASGIARASSSGQHAEHCSDTGYTF